MHKLFVGLIRWTEHVHKLFVGLIRQTACARAQFSGCCSKTNAHSETGKMAVCCQNLPLGALSSRIAPSVLVGELFKKFGLFLNTGEHLWPYLAQFILVLKMCFLRNVVQKVDTHQHHFFFRKSCRLWDNVGKYGISGQATDDNIIERMRILCWLRTATNTHWEYVINIYFPLRQWLYERASVLTS